MVVWYKYIYVMNYKGKYRVKNPSKYRGDFNNCVFRSLWERKFMRYCDTNKNVIFWSSEEVVIPYISPLDGRRRNYFVDFWVRIKKKNGKTEDCLIEIKPKSQTQPPVLGEGKITPTKRRQLLRYALNKRKWQAAKDFCESRGWRFVIVTEKELFGKRGN